MEVYYIPEHGHTDAYMIQGTESTPRFTSPVIEQFEGMYNNGSLEFAAQQGLYYPTATPTDYGYICTGMELPSNWNDHQRIFGLDGQEIQYAGPQAENFPYIYYTPSSEYSQSPYNPYNPYIPGAMIGVDGSYIGSQEYYNIPMYENDVSSGYYPVAVESRPDIPHNITPEPFVNTAAYISSGTGGHGLKHNFSPASAAFTLNSSKVTSDLTRSLPRGPNGSKINGRPSKQPVTHVSIPSSGYSNASASNVFQGGAIQVVDNASRGNVWSNRNQLKVDPLSNGLSNFVSSSQGRSLMDKVRTNYNVGRATKDVNGSPDASFEQNRGPRTNKLINQLAVKAYTSRAGDSDAQGNIIIHTDQYNREDFPDDYVNAKFFVIKSYSEDDVHKSIKYNVWSSTPNGNKKLNLVYADAQKIAGDEPKGCPIFLFFSVNVSGQFCGVAEMTGPVDFHKDMDFWQQDKWCGSFPVKWHIIKDVPNPSLRHIILENNENKPVTNSRDTQEIRYKKGMEMLKVFKHYVSKTSLLDDFMYYENRQKLLQAEKARLLIKSLENPFIVSQIEPPCKLNGVVNPTLNEDEKSKKLNNESSSDQSVSIPTEQDLLDKEIKASAAKENGTSVADDDREEKENGMLRIGSLSIKPKKAEINPVDGAARAQLPVTATSNAKAINVISTTKVNGSAKSVATLTFGTVPHDLRALGVDVAGLSKKDASRKG